MKVNKKASLISCDVFYSLVSFGLSVEYISDEHIYFILEHKRMLWVVSEHPVEEDAFKSGNLKWKMYSIGGRQY